MYKIRIFITFITSVDLFMSQIFIRCSNLANVSSTATTANNKVQLNGPIKIIAYAGDGSWSFQQQYSDGNILSLNINDTQIAYDYYDGKNWTRKWTK